MLCERFCVDILTYSAKIVIRILAGGPGKMSKLTLSVDDETIRFAKAWARKRGLSLSQAVSVFFDSLAASKKMPEEMPPILRKLTGILKKDEASVKKYHDHLESKYL
jgi:antitoxin component of RelBE/YafQ-DinJ toxin-antitoxin module